MASRAGSAAGTVPAGSELAAIRRALIKMGVDVAAASRETALHLLESNAAYLVHGNFHPEQTMQVFNDAIDQALKDGFTGFRAAAEMSWALDAKDGANQLIVYEALLRSLFSTSRATGLCLYDQRRMPLRVVNGALMTHPVVGAPTEYRRNPYYKPSVRSLETSDDRSVRRKLAALRRAGVGDQAGAVRSPASSKRHRL